MTDELNMSEHITRREFQDAILSLATKRELEIWGGALIGRMDAQFETFQLHMDFMRRNMEAIRRDMQRDMETMRSELQTHLARLEPSRPVVPSVEGASQDGATCASPWRAWRSCESRVSLSSACPLSGRISDTRPVSGQGITPE